MSPIPLLLKKAFEGADVVYHLAGVIEINKGNEDMTWKVNVDGTKNVVEACKKCGVKRLVYASSVDAYPPLPDNQVMREISHFNPEILDGTYAKTKATATNYVFENNDDKLETVVCYPGACCGPMTSRSLPSARWSECSSRASSPYRSPSAHITSLTCAMLPRA